jgi:peptidoglycan/xylan/chitin deacetylase (PgdA/CDA1 family)
VAAAADGGERGVRTISLRLEQPDRPRLRQLVAGLVALPLSAIPFVGYANLTPEGRLVRDRAMVALKPPSLPKLSPQQKTAAVQAAPQYQGAVMALAYHGIGSASDAEGGFVISPKRFAEHLATLKAAEMHTVTAAQVAAAFAGGEPLPPNAVMLSFDDGRADAMMFADPLLAQAGMSATMFVITEAASKPGVYYASWDRIEAYARTGRWDIQSHTAASHKEQKVTGGESLPALTSRAAGESLSDYERRIRADLAKARAAIQEHVGKRPVAFAYPFGAYGGDRSNDKAIQAVLRAEVSRQYSIAFQQDDQTTVPLLTPDQDPLLLRRVEVQDWSGMELLQRIEQARKSSQAAAAAAMGSPPAGGSSGQPPSGQSQPGGPNGAPSTVNQSPAAGTTLAQTGAGLLSVPRVSIPDLSGAGLGAPAVTVPPTSVTLPPVTVTVPPVTIPPVVSVPTTLPPVTSPPTTSPPTTAPPSTSPPTTACREAGKSGKCTPGKG